MFMQSIHVSKSKKFAFKPIKYSWTLLLYLFVSTGKTIGPRDGFATPTSVCFATPQSGTDGGVIVIIREL